MWLKHLWKNMSHQYIKIFLLCTFLAPMVVFAEDVSDTTSVADVTQESDYTEGSGLDTDHSGAIQPPEPDLQWENKLSAPDNCTCNCTPHLEGCGDGDGNDGPNMEEDDECPHECNCSTTTATKPQQTPTTPILRPRSYDGSGQENDPSYNHNNFDGDELDSAKSSSGYHITITVIVVLLVISGFVLVLFFVFANHRMYRAFPQYHE